MFQRPKTRFLLLLLAGILALWVDLPNNFIVTIPFTSQTIVLNPPVIDISPFGNQIKKEFKTQLGLDLAGGTHIGLEADMQTIPLDARMDALSSAREVIERRVNFFGVSEPIVQTVKSGEAYRISVDLPGITDAEAALSLLGQTAMLEFREFTEDDQASPGAILFPTLANTESVGITGKDLKKAAVSFSTQTGEPEVAITFTPDGSTKFAEVTKRLIGKNLAIFLDDVPVTWPTVSTEILDGSAVITGSFTTDEAKRLALQLNAGALPVPVTVVEKKTVGATLGEASVKQSITAGLIGLSLVALFMILKYGFLGFLADCALLLYGLFTLALYRLIPVTLTLPGIAGFILSIGMAVDSNILIFERFREELRRGKPWKIALELGFGKAWESIRDANFTTILTAIILFNPANWNFLPSSGLVRGFAATLFIGVIISLFTGIVVTRTFIRVFYKGPRVIREKGSV